MGSLSGRPPQTHKPTQIHAATFNQPNEKASYICLNPPQALYIYIPFIVPTHHRSPVADVNLPPTFPIPDSLYGYFVVGPGSGLRRLELAWIGYGIYIDIDNIPNCPHDSAFSLCRDVTVGYGRKEKNSKWQTQGAVRGRSYKRYRPPSPRVVTPPFAHHSYHSYDDDDIRPPSKCIGPASSPSWRSPKRRPTTVARVA